MTSMDRYLRPPYGQVTLVSRYPVLTVVNWSQHWCKLAKKYEIEHWSRSSKTINWSANSFQINHVTSMSRHMSPWYGHVILVSGYPVLKAVNWPYCECSILKMWILSRHSRHTPLFILIVSPTPPVQSAYVPTLGQSNDNQTKRGWPYSMGMGLCSSLNILSHLTLTFLSCVLDIQKPSFKKTCPLAQNVIAERGKTTARVIWSKVTAEDNDGKPMLTTSPKVISPHEFSEGFHTVTYTATDQSENTNVCYFKVNVQGSA